MHAKKKEKNMAKKTRKKYGTSHAQQFDAITIANQQLYKDTTLQFPS